MNLIDRLKEMEVAARQAADSDYCHDDERRDTAESFDFAYALQDAWPQIRAFIETYDDWEENGGFYAQPGEKLTAARKALNEEKG